MSSLVQAPFLFCHANNTKCFSLFGKILNIEFFRIWAKTGNVISEKLHELEWYDFHQLFYIIVLLLFLTLCDNPLDWCAFITDNIWMQKLANFYHCKNVYLVQQIISHQMAFRTNIQRTNVDTYQLFCVPSEWRQQHRPQIRHIVRQCPQSL